MARWFALWAVNAKHGAEALSSAPAPSGGKPDKRGGSSVAAAGPPPITAADVELLPDAQAERILSEGEPMMTALRLAAGLVGHCLDFSTRSSICHGMPARDPAHVGNSLGACQVQRASCPVPAPHAQLLLLHTLPACRCS